jgi:hypothetical protein
VSFALVLATSGFPVATLGRSMPNLGAAKFRMPAYIKPGSYKIRISSSFDIFVLSNPVDIKPCLHVKGCGGNGVCTSTGECECLNNYSGDFCELAPIDEDVCALVRCAYGAGCDSTTGKCDCVGNFTGDACDVPVGAPTCNLICLNRGIRNFDCTSCECLADSAFVGPRCDKCHPTLDEYCIHGHLNPDCKSCTCDKGYFGDRCSLRFYKAEIGPFTVDPAADPKTFSSGLLKDLEALLGPGVIIGDVTQDKAEFFLPVPPEDPVDDAASIFSFVADIKTVETDPEAESTENVLGALGDLVADPTSEFYQYPFTGTVDSNNTVYSYALGTEEGNDGEPVTDDDSKGFFAQYWYVVALLVVFGVVVTFFVIRLRKRSTIVSQPAHMELAPTSTGETA